MLARSPQPETLSISRHGALVKLTTDRLHIRPFEQADVADQYLGWLQDAEVTRFSNQRFRHHTMESCLRYRQLSQCQRLPLIIHRRDETQLEPRPSTTPPHGTADIGLMLGNRTYWRRGLGLEAWSSMRAASGTRSAQGDRGHGQTEHRHGEDHGRIRDEARGRASPAGTD